MSTSQNKLGFHSLGTTFSCTCGHTHSLPIRACHVGDDAAERLARFAREHCSTSAFVIADENTRKASGDAPLNSLRAGGKRTTEYVYDSDVEATGETADALAERAAGHDFLVGIGSGTLADLAKYAADKLGVPALLYPTAASMNGYTSAIAALKVRGLKRTLPCAPALGVFADPRVVATAPRRMTAAGVADFLSKASSSTDWRASHLLLDAYYCERPREFFEGTQEALLCAAQRLDRGEERAYAVIIEALLLSGLSMVVAGSSAPASGGEHLISHYLDMKAALYGTPHDLHGAQVGVATIDCLKLWYRILDLDPGDIDVDSLVAAREPEADIESAIDNDWGPVALEVHEQWSGKRMSDDALRAHLERFKRLLPRFREELPHDLLPPEIVAKAIQAAGGPITPEELDAPLDEYRNARLRARFIRDRFTVLDLAADLRFAL